MAEICVRMSNALREPGVYRAYADFQIDGKNRALATDLFVPGDFEPSPLPEPAPVNEVDGYSSELAPSQPFQAGQARTLTFSITRGESPVEDLQPYLGARGHLVALREGDLGYPHMHPDESVGDVRLDKPKRIRQNTDMEASVLDLADRLRTEADAYEMLEELRWGDRPVCPHCASTRKLYFLKPNNGTSRKTRTGTSSERRVWKCADCRKQFSVLTGTVFHGTKIPVRKWCFVVFEMCAAKNGVSAREIERKYDLTPKTAWFMLHRLREAMRRDPLAGLLSGRVVADETWYGGKPINRHGYNPATSVSGQTDKSQILSLVSRETGEVRSQVIPNVRGENLRRALIDLDAPNTHLHTDASHAYKRIAGDFASHTYVDHKAREWVKGDASTNQAEAFFSQLKRSLDGTHHHVSKKHLGRYLSEFDFRFSTRMVSDSARVSLLMGQTGGRRLAYRQP